MIAVIDYGMGNLMSVQKGFETVGFSAEITSDPDKLRSAGGIVLPGVGAFKDARASLKSNGMDVAIKEAISKGIPFLGICLGFQLLFDYSQEWGTCSGLGILPGFVTRFSGDIIIPHMGWNQVKLLAETPLMQGIPDNSSFYFVHSYYVNPADSSVTAGVTQYGVLFASMIAKDNIFGVQFHPEKSSLLGLKILANFGKLVKKSDCLSCN